ncbi:hypothetical protein NKR23_g1274 [Pleurostoma richardsiae]|uniref:Uncharacterized protein n=1 Tax=Pleurostoma richardsiae TaxID=41990 RepID=A0AA38VPR4_9PEZI|nr:hypothetical protein NKR23_g1274 [Pleurostoma richardsiae]
MSPIVARAAIRASARATGQRNFSIMRSMRNFARSFEAHPFEKMPVTTNSQAPDYAKMVKRVGTQAIIYVPGLTFLLGWPLMVKQGIDGHVGNW